MSRMLILLLICSVSDNPSNDIRIVERYSIFVKQLIHNKEANGFYRVLNNFSESESLFSQVQPDFIEGNIVSETNLDKKGLDFFEVSKASEKCMFFDKIDVLGEDLPKFSLECNVVCLEPGGRESINRFLQRLCVVINSCRLKYIDPLDEFLGYTFVHEECRDCTILG